MTRSTPARSASTPSAPTAPCSWASRSSSTSRTSTSSTSDPPVRRPAVPCAPPAGRPRTRRLLVRPSEVSHARVLPAPGPAGPDRRSTARATPRCGRTCSQALADTGWHNYSLFLRDDGLLIGYVETPVARGGAGRHGTHRGQRPVAGRDGRVLRGPRGTRARTRASWSSRRSSTWRTSWPRSHHRRSGDRAATRKKTDDDQLRRDRPPARGAGDRGPLVGLRQLRHPVQGVRQPGHAAHRAGEDRGRRRRCTASPGWRRRWRCTSRGTTVDDFAALREYAEGLGVRLGTVNSNTFQDDDYKLGSLTHRDPAIRQKAIDHNLACIDVMDATGSRDLKIWLADGTNYPGQDDLRARQDRLAESLADDLRAARRRPAAGARVQVLRAGVLPHRRPRLGHVVRPVRGPRRAGRGVPRHRSPRARHQHRVHRRCSCCGSGSSAPSTSTAASTPTTT